jgi:hypothetical protein
LAVLGEIVDIAAAAAAAAAGVILTGDGAGRVMTPLPAGTTEGTTELIRPDAPGRMIEIGFLDTAGTV